tara:strand:- start:54 stop:1406 length:1353 start_codon:yes stop_codon:yes gene_type:complete
MKYLVLLYLSITFSSLPVLNASDEYQLWLKESETPEICEVKQEYAFNFYYTKNDNPDVWLLGGTAHFMKGELWGLKYRDYDTFKQNPKFVNGNISTKLAYPEGNRDNKIELTSRYTKQLTKDELFDCYKNQIIRKKISYDSFNVFTQNDLFNGLSDNEKITAYGYLEIPKFKECKNVKKFPVMFLVHHSGGSIMNTYKYHLQKKCIATFEPQIFLSRDIFRNYFDPNADIQWITETQGALDVLKAIDVIANNNQIDSSKIGIMGWSYGGIVAIEAQNMFNIDLIKPKNEFSLNIAYYSFCYHYENTKTTNAPLRIFIGKADKTPYSICNEWVDQISINKPQKQIVIYENAFHNFDGAPLRMDTGSLPDPECRIYTDNNGTEWVRPNNPDMYFNITENGGWYGRDGDSIKRARARKLCWEFGTFEIGRDQEAYEDSWKKFNSLVDKHLSPF